MSEVDDFGPVHTDGVTLAEWQEAGYWMDVTPPAVQPIGRTLADEARRTIAGRRWWLRMGLGDAAAGLLGDELEVVAAAFHCDASLLDCEHSTFERLPVVVSLFVCHGYAPPACLAQGPVAWSRHLATCGVGPLLVSDVRNG
jgi:hypothetical protein